MAFWHPGEERPAQPIDRDGDAMPVYNPLSGFSIDVQRRRLPIFEHRQAILYAITQNGVTIVVADVGAGKSTQIPQYLHETGWTAGGRMIACTQPRRVAAKTVAARVAEEMGVRLGADVGYSIRFDDVTHPTQTRIKFVTDGMLLREMLVDPLLRRYSVVMVDEAHERSLQSDVLMGLLRKVRRVRPTLRVVISSATLEADRFRDFFDASAEVDLLGQPLPAAPAQPLPPAQKAPEEDDDEAGGGALVVELPPAHQAALLLAEASKAAAAAAAPGGSEDPPAERTLITSYPVTGGVAGGVKRRRTFRASRSDSEEDDGEGIHSAAGGPSSLARAAADGPAATAAAGSASGQAGLRASRWGPANASVSRPLAATSAAAADAAGGGSRGSGGASDLVSPALIAAARARAAAAGHGGRFGAAARAAAPPLPAPPPPPPPSRIPPPDLSRAVVIAVEGRTHPVDVLYAEAPVEDVVAAAAEAALGIHAREGPGDVLVFLHGAEAVEAACALIREGLPAALGLASGEDVPEDRALSVAPLYASLPWEAQLRALEPARVTKRGAPVRKVIVSTNIAETSLTIEGVCFVVDSGLVKVPVFDPAMGVEAMLTVPVSQAAAAQRAGRAGRVRPGKCLRLYTEAAHAALPARALPEMVRSELAPALLLLLALGVRNVARFDFVDPPAPPAVVRGLELLYATGAIDGSGALTAPVGRAMADLPTDPRTAAFLLAALSAGCAEHAITIAAMASVAGGSGGSIFVGWRAGAGRTQAQASDAAAREFAVREGDHLTLLNVYRAYEIAGRSKQWCAAHCVSASAMARATEVRAQLRQSLAALIARERTRRQRAKEKRAAASAGGGATAAGVRGRSRIVDEDEDADTYVVRVARAPPPTSAAGAAADDAAAAAAAAADPSSKWSLTTDAAFLDDDDDSGGGEGGGAALLTALRRCLVAGFFSNAARLGPGGRYVTVKEGQAASLHPSSVLERLGGIPPEWVIYGGAVWAAGELQLADVTAINPRWLLELAPHYYEAHGGYREGDAAAAGGGYLGAAAAAAGAGTAAPGSAAAAAPAPAPLPVNLAYKSAAQRKREREEAAALEEAAAAQAAEARRVARQQAQAPPPAAAPGRGGAGSGIAGVLGLLFGDEAAAGGGVLG